MAKTLAQKFITIVMPVRNEEKFIAETIGMLLAQDYPAERFEIIVADGMSDDRTREIVSGIALENPQVILLDNPKRRSSSGRNVGFKAGKGAYFLVVDGHCHIPNNQLLANVDDCFKRSGAQCLGRPQPLDPPGITAFQKAVALARGSTLGHGVGSKIFCDIEGFVPIASNGSAYRREVFDKIGYVDEQFDACEDVEFNYRADKAGLLGYTSSSLTVKYFPRETLRGLFRQLMRYGLGRYRLYQKHPETLGLTTLLPALFVFGAVWLAAAGFAASDTILFTLPALVYLLCTVVLSLESLRIKLKNPETNFLVLILIFFTIYFALGIGFIRGLSINLFTKWCSSRALPRNGAV